MPHKLIDDLAKMILKAKQCRPLQVGIDRIDAAGKNDIGDAAL